MRSNRRCITENVLSSMRTMGWEWESVMSMRAMGLGLSVYQMLERFVVGFYGLGIAKRKKDETIFWKPGNNRTFSLHKFLKALDI